MLKALRRIVQEINASEALTDALGVVVDHVQVSIEGDVSTIFLLDESQGEYVLAATKGLESKLQGAVRFKLGEGLVGLVGEREEPMNISDAQAHERYVPYPKHADKELRAFLGVPILYQRQVQGVLVVRQKESREFDDAEVAFMVTLAAQLAGAIAQSKSAGAFPDFSLRAAGKGAKGKVFSGVSGAPGVAIGRAVVVYPFADLDAVPERKTDDTRPELDAFTKALKATKRQMKQLAETISSQLPEEEQSLFEVYLKILDSASLTKEIRKEIRAGYVAQAAIKRVVNRHVRQFEAMEDRYLAERATDFKDLGQRLLYQLQSGKTARLEYPKRTILVGEEVTPAALVEVPEACLAGVVSSRGSTNAHVAILARALGVPTAMGVSGIPLSQVDGKEIIIDGYYGQVYVAPNPSLRREFRSLLKEEKELDATLQALRDLPAETIDGHDISLFVNTGLAADISRSLSVGAQGVGLYRTEVPFMMRDRFPSEDEQRVVYRQLLSAFAPRPVMMRTLDIGGDKPLPYFPFEEENPYLGWRGIRVTLDHPDIFLVQLRAMLRASEGYDNLHIMLPMVGSIVEVEAALRLISQAHSELIEEGIAVKMPGVGVMIEVPSAIYQLRELAKRVDFFSVGSNDLTQYILAVDRNNAQVSNLYDGLHPAVLRALSQIVKEARKARKYISICGELAGDPLSVVLLLAMGFDTLSVTATSLPRIKWVVRNFTLTRAKELLNEVLAMDDPVDVRCHMELALEEAGLAGLIRAGK